MSFLESLTDDRVLQQKAPFDHPQLFVPNGAVGNHLAVQVGPDGTALDNLIEIPAVGKNGGPSAKAFLQP